MCKINSLYYHNAINIKSAHIHIMLLRHYCRFGDVSPTSELAFWKAKKVNVLHIKPKKKVYTSNANQITTSYTQTMVKKRPDVINISVVTEVTSALKQVSLRDKEKDVLQI
jgi:hypothetical protein